MTKRELQERRERMERRRKRRRIRRLRMAIKAAVYTLIALAMGLVVWVIASLFVGDDHDSSKEKETEDVVNEQAADEQDADEDSLQGEGITEDDSSETPDSSDPSGTGTLLSGISGDALPGEGDAKKDTYTGTTGLKGWNVDENGWWYLNDDESVFKNGWKTIDGQDYYFDENGYMATGWKNVNGDYHYFRQDGIEEPGATEKLVAITYDDGPGSYTDRLLNCLQANGAKATFFVVGEQVEIYKETLQRAASMGMEIGSHTYDHPYLTHLDSESIAENMAKNEQVITDTIGHGTALMRPTGGGVNDTIRNTVNCPMINWDLDTKDWETKDTEAIVNEVLSNVQDGSVVLLHDLYETTVAASEIFIPELVARGYRMVTVSELASLRGVTLEAGKVYNSFYIPTEETGVDVLDPAA